MSKKIVCLIIGMVVLSGITIAEEKLSLEFGYKTDSWKAELKEEVWFLLKKGNNWKDEFVLTNPRIEKSSIQYYSKASYSPFSWLSFNATIGIGKTKMDFDNLDFTEIHSWTYNNIPNSYSLKRPMDPVNIESEMEFFYGAGLAAQLYRNENFSITLLGQYTHQNLPNTFRIYNYESESPSYPFEIFYWGEYIEVERSKIQEVEIKINFSTYAEKFKISGGPVLFLAKINYSGHVHEFFGVKDFHNPDLSRKYTRQEEMQFTVRNKNLIGVFGKISYVMRNSEIFFKLSANAKKTVQAGIKINL